MLTVPLLLLRTRSVAQSPSLEATPGSAPQDVGSQSARRDRDAGRRSEVIGRGAVPSEDVSAWRDIDGRDVYAVLWSPEDLARSRAAASAMQSNPTRAERRTP